MSIFNNCSGTGSAGGDALPVGALVPVRGNLAAPAGYRFVDGQAYGGSEQGRGPTDVYLPLPELDAAPVAGVSDSFCVGRANNGYFLYEKNGGAISPFSIQFREAGGQWLSGLSAWPTAIAAAGVRQICALDVISSDTTRRFAAVVATDDQHHFIVWDVDGLDWTEVLVVSVPASGDALPQCFSHLPQDETVCVGISRSADFFVLNPDTMTAETLSGAPGMYSPGSGVDACLASRTDGRALFGSRYDNLIRARKLSVVDIEGSRYVASPFKSTVMPVAGLSTSAQAVAVVNLTDDDFDLLAPFGWFRIEFTEVSATVRQIAARHPLISSAYSLPMAATYLDPFFDIFVMVYFEKLDNGKYAVRELDLAREALLSTFFRYAEKVV